MALIISTWLWGTRYGPDYIAKLEAGIRRNLSKPVDFRVFRPLAEDMHLTEMKGCFARLRAFDPAWQAANGIEPGDRIVCIDLDTVITGSLDGLFDRPEPFVILQGANQSNPNPMNGSVWMLRAGHRPDVWTDFSLEAAELAPRHSFPDDQGWLWHKFGDDYGAWPCGEKSGIWAFGKQSWPKDDHLPASARIVAFPGYRDPSQFTHLPWVERHWKL